MWARAATQAGTTHENSGLNYSASDIGDREASALSARGNFNMSHHLASYKPSAGLDVREPGSFLGLGKARPYPLGSLHLSNLY